MNESNLIPMSERTEEEVRELAKKGGIASGEARRRKKSIRESLDLLLSKPFNLNTKAGKEVKKQIAALGIDPKEIDNQTAMAYAMFLTTMSGGKGAVGAFNSIRDTLGEKPVEVISQDINAEVSEKRKNAIDDVIAQMKPIKEDDA